MTPEADPNRQLCLDRQQTTERASSQLIRRPRGTTVLRGQDQHMRLLGRRQTGWVLFCWFLMVVCGCTETTASVSGASCTAPLLTTVPNAAVSRPVVVSPGQTLRILRVRIPDLPRYQRAAPGQPLHWSHRVCDPGSQSAAPGYRSRAYARRHLCHHYSCPFAAPARASHGTNLPASRRAHSSPDPLAAGLLARGSHAGSYCFYRRRLGT